MNSIDPNPHILALGQSHGHGADGRICGPLGSSKLNILAANPVRRFGDFTRWKEHDAYSKALDRLLRDLRVEKS